jgi:transcription termination factor Rho
MELHLDRKLAERRIFPAMDMVRSGTRREELLLDEGTLTKIWLMRRVANLVSANSQSPTEATERILERLSKTANNAEFLKTLTKDI